MLMHETIDHTAQRPLTVAWISHFPVEWLPDVPEPLKRLPRHHPSTWQRVLLDELKTLRSLKLHVIALRKEFPESMMFDHDGVTFHLVKTPPRLRAPSLFWVDTLLIRRALKRIRPDLVHAWGTEHGAALVASRLGYPYLVTIQGLMSWLAETVPADRYRKVVARLEHWGLRRASIVTAESRFAVDYIRQRHPHLEVCQIEHVPSRLFHEVIRRPRTDPFRLMYVGTLNQAKGGDVLLRALQSLNVKTPFQLTVIGKAQEGFAQSLPADLVGRVWPLIKFKENLTSSQVAQELAETAILVCPTRADTGPVAVKEAVVAGVPVVASAVGGVPDYVVPDRNGFLCAPGDPGSLAEALQKMPDHPLFSRGLVDAEILAEKRDYLSPDQMAKGFLEAYQLVLKRRAPDECRAVMRQ